MSRQNTVLTEQVKLQEERGHIVDELAHLRELMQAEVDVEPDEGDAEIFEREKNAGADCRARTQAPRYRCSPTFNRERPVRHLRALQQSD